MEIKYLFAKNVRLSYLARIGDYLNNSEELPEEHFYLTKGIIYPFNHSINYHVGAPEEKELATGIHEV